MKEFVEELAEFLRGGMGNSIEISREYPDGYAKRPLDAAVLCIGIDKISTEAGGFLAGSDEGERYATRMDITLRFDIMRPDGAQGCHDIFSRLCEMLLGSDCPVRVSKISCGELGYNRMIGGFCLSARAEAAGMVAETRSAENITDFVVRGSGYAGN